MKKQILYQTDNIKESKAIKIKVLQICISNILLNLRNEVKVASIIKSMTMNYNIIIIFY